MRSQNSTLKGIFCLIIISLFALACSKDKFTTKPQLEFQKVSSYHVKQGDRLRFDFVIRDAEGDIQNYVYMHKDVKHFPSLSLTDSFPVAQHIPKVKDLNANLQVCFFVNVTNEECPPLSAKSPIESDTASFSFWIIDKGKNSSDTVRIDQPIIVENH